jgi:hypothetical protein
MIPRGAWTSGTPGSSQNHILQPHAWKVSHAWLFLHIPAHIHGAWELGTGHCAAEPVMAFFSKSLFFFWVSGWIFFLHNFLESVYTDLCHYWWPSDLATISELLLKSALSLSVIPINQMSLFYSKPFHSKSHTLYNGGKGYRLPTRVLYNSLPLAHPMPVTPTILWAHQKCSHLRAFAQARTLSSRNLHA